MTETTVIFYSFNYVKYDSFDNICIQMYKNV